MHTKRKKKKSLTSSVRKTKEIGIYAVCCTCTSIQFLNFCFRKMQTHHVMKFLGKIPHYWITHCRGSSIGLAGCGIWNFFAVIFGIWVKNREGKRELQLQAGAGFRVFMKLGCGIRKGNRAGYRISIVW